MGDVTPPPPPPAATPRATERTYGHRDRTGKERCGDLEWKVTYELEADDAWTAGPLLEALPDFGMLPAGALGYVRTKAATICRAGRDG